MKKALFRGQAIDASRGPVVVEEPRVEFTSAEEITDLDAVVFIFDIFRRTLNVEDLMLTREPLPSIGAVGLVIGEYARYIAEADSEKDGPNIVNALTRIGAAAAAALLDAMRLGVIQAVQREDGTNPGFLFERKPNMEVN